MAISKSKSRPITVEGIDYRWALFENSGWNDLTVQSASGNGKKLTVQIEWNPDNVSPLPYNPVKPSFVEMAIKFGLENGWNPNIEGKPFECRFTESAFSTRRAEH
ncbi:MAG: hypothetical protein ACR2OW_05820 [Methyloligellaceae bacterium]